MQQRALSMVARVVLAGWCVSCLAGCGAEAPPTTTGTSAATSKAEPAPAKAGKMPVRGVPGGKGGPD